VDIKGWEEIFNEQWKANAKPTTSDYPPGLLVMDYRMAKEVFRRCFQQATYQGERKVITDKSNYLRVPSETFRLLKRTDKYYPSDMPSAKCKCLYDKEKDLYFYVFIEDFI